MSAMINTPADYLARKKQEETAVQELERISVEKVIVEKKSRTCGKTKRKDYL